MRIFLAALITIVVIFCFVAAWGAATGEREDGGSGEDHP